MYSRADDPGWMLMKAILRQWISEAAAPIVIYPIPTPEHISEIASPAGYLRRFHELDDPPRVTVHDSLPDLHRYSLSERRGFRFDRDRHPTVAGHRAHAESLAPLIQSLVRAEAL